MLSVMSNDGTPLPFPFAEDGLLCDSVGGRNIVMIPFSGNETLYGLGLGYQNLCRNYEAVPLRCDHYGGKDNGRTHVPTPFYVSIKGYGIFIDTAEYPAFYNNRASGCPGVLFLSKEKTVFRSHDGQIGNSRSV